jgi:hypothetical protein
LAVVKAAIAMHQYDRRPFTTGAWARKKTIDDFFAAAMRRVHGNDSFTHCKISTVRGKQD